jgi:hypothetical protein
MGEHGESFDEAAVIKKSKQGIVVAVFSGFASGSYKCPILSKLTIILPY